MKVISLRSGMGTSARPPHALSEMQVLQGSSRSRSGRVMVKLVLEERGWDTP